MQCKARTFEHHHAANAKQPIVSHCLLSASCRKHSSASHPWRHMTLSKTAFILALHLSPRPPHAGKILLISELANIEEHILPTSINPMKVSTSTVTLGINARYAHGSPVTCLKPQRSAASGRPMALLGWKISKRICFSRCPSPARDRFFTLPATHLFPFNLV
jgi:hypothetical protein